MMAASHVMQAPPIWILLILLISNVSISADKDLPSFVDLPPPVQYFTTGGPLSLLLKCRVWPPSATVQFLASSKQPWSRGLSKQSPDLQPLEGHQDGSLSITSERQLTNLADLNIHCLATTSFGSVLSRPFRITRAGMSEFGGEAATVERTVLLGNVALVDCWPPESHPRAEVLFKRERDGVEIVDGGRYRKVVWPGGRRVSLLVQPAEEGDGGLYRCEAVNPVTRQRQASPSATRLTVARPPGPVPPSVVLPLSGDAKGPQTLQARRGANLTLVCLMAGAPPPRVTVHRLQGDQDPQRHFQDPDFGLLRIKDARASDSGTYVCGDRFLTSTAVLRVSEPLSLVERPTDLVVDSLPASANFRCRASSGAVPVQWLLNGRPLKGTQAAQGVLKVRAVPGPEGGLGVYQCVAQDRHEWVSAAATLSLRGDLLRSRPAASESMTAGSGLQEGDGEEVRPPQPMNVDEQQRVLGAPSLSRMLDNVAVLVRWEVYTHVLGEVAHFLLQYEARGADEVAWGPAITVQKRVQPDQRYFYATGALVRPQQRYRYRVHALFSKGHTVTSVWSPVASFLDVGEAAPEVLETTVVEAAPPSPGVALKLRWAYRAPLWPVDTFRIIYRAALANGTGPSPLKFGGYLSKDVPAPSNNVTIENLEPDRTYQLTMYGINKAADRRTTTIFSPLHTFSTPSGTKAASPEVTSSSATSRFFYGLLESWKSNKLLYGSLFALTCFLILVMLLLLLLCICRQRRSHNNKDSSSTHTFPYSYKEVSKASAANNSTSTLQMPGRMPQYSSQIALQQFQSNNGTVDRRGNQADSVSLIHRAGSSQAMETASLSPDMFSPGYQNLGPQYHPGFSTLPQGFSTLPQGYGLTRGNPQYQHFLKQQQQAYMDSLRREKPTGESNRDSMTDQSVDMMPPRNMSASQQQLMMMQQSQEQHQLQQQHLQHQLQQQQQQQQLQQQQQRAQMGFYGQRQGAVSPQMMMMMGSQQSLGPYGQQYRRSASQGPQEPMQVYQTERGLVDGAGRPLSPHYQQYLLQQQQQRAPLTDIYCGQYVRPGDRLQYRGPDSDCGNMEPVYSDLGVARQHAILNSLPEQPTGDCNSQREHSPGMAVEANGSGRHHHRRKTRPRAQNPQDDNPAQERVQGGQDDMPPMLAPRSKVSYPSESRPESGATGEGVEPPVQYSCQEEGIGMAGSLPRLRDASEYGMRRTGAPVPPSKTTGPRSGQEAAQDCYYSSATSSDRSGSGAQPHYDPGADQAYMAGLYYHADTHC